VSNTLRVDCFTVDLTAGELFKHGAKVHLRDQSFRVLAALLERPGDVVTRDELRRRLWPGDVFVDFENNLNTAVARLREALGDSADRPRFVETLPKRGYRFIAPVAESSVPAPQVSQRPSKLLVLPFVSWSSATGASLADALTDEVITSLAGFAPESLAVIARTTTMHYKGTRKDVASIAQELAIDYVLEGGLRGGGDAVTLNVQLIRVSDQTHIWARRYDTTAAGIFDLHVEMANAVACALGLPAAGPRARRVRKPTNDLIAYTLYQEGRHRFAKGTPQALAAAKQCLDQALARDPQFALAHDALAELHWYLGFFGVLPARSVTSAGLFHALRALDFDDSLAETHALVGLFRKEFDFNWADVKRQMDRALELDPVSPLVKTRFAIGWLLAEGRLQEAVKIIEEALETDPLSVFMRAWLTCMLWLDRQFDRAIEQGRLTSDLEPTSFLGHWTLGMALRDSGRSEASVDAHYQALELWPQSPLLLGSLSLALGQAGRMNDAVRMKQQLDDAAAAGTYVAPTCFAWSALALGELDDAFAWMARAVEACDHMIVPIRHYPFLDTLRDDPRYAELLQRLRMKPSVGVLVEAI